MLVNSTAQVIKETKFIYNDRNQISELMKAWRQEWNLFGWKIHTRGHLGGTEMPLC
jgi:hypothetical protein